MFDHVKFGVSDYVASKAFFLKALEPLGVTVATEWPPNGVELSWTCPVFVDTVITLRVVTTPTAVPLRAG